MSNTTEFFDVLSSHSDRQADTCATKPRRDGFTLIEIMAVVVIMGMLMGLVGVSVLGQVEKAQITATRTKIAQLESAMEFYKMDNFKYPPTLEALISKPAGAKNYPKGGYLKKREALKDPWDIKFIYLSPGSKNQHSVDISSAGPDSVAGNADDINNWDSESADES